MRERGAERASFFRRTKIFRRTQNGAEQEIFQKKFSEKISENLQKLQKNYGFLRIGNPIS